MEISCYSSVKSQTPSVLSWEKFLEITGSQRVCAIANNVKRAIANNDAAAKDSWKKQLPIATWQAKFVGARKNTEAIPTGLFMLDVDHLEELPEKVYSEKIAGKLDKLGIVLVHKTISCKGLRVVALCRPEFKSLAENQTWLSNELMLENDPACKDFARSSFIVPFEYFFYIKAEIFNASFEAPFRLESTETFKPSKPYQTALPYQAENNSNSSTPRQQSYKGILLLDIATNWLKEYHGGYPEEGERNTVLFELASQMRYICDFKPAVIAANIPHCGLEDNEIMSLCSSACNGTRQRSVPTKLTRIIRTLKDPQSECTDEIKIDAIEQPTIPELPPIFKEFYDSAPDDFKQAVVLCLLPMLGTLASRLRAQYLSGKWESPSFMVALEAPQASGKSFIENVCEICLQDIKLKDESEREKEEEFDEKIRIMKTSGANTKAEREHIRNLMEQRPVPLIRKMPATTSITKLLIRMNNAQGLHLFALAVEIDTVTKAFKRGFSNLSDLLRCSFDNSEFGQEYASETSFSGNVRIYYNTLFSGTPAAMRRFYTNSEDGTMSRTLFITLPDQFGKKMPIWKSMTPGTTNALRNKLNELYQTSIVGDEIQDIKKMDLSYLNVALADWNENQRILSIDTEDRTRNTFYRRCAEVGFRAGMIAHWLYYKDNYKLRKSEEEKVVRFSIWVAESMLRQFLLRIELNVEDAALGNLFARSVYVTLPDEFSRQTLKDKLVEMGFKSPISKVLSRWKAAGFVEMKDKYNAQIIIKKDPDAKS